MPVASGSNGSGQGNADKKPLSIVLVEDHEILREGLKALIDLEPDLRVVGDYAGVDACLQEVGDLKPDLLLTDLTLPGRSGIDLLGEIKRRSPDTRRMVLTAHDSEEYIRAALQQGAHGYVLKEAGRVELMQAIRTVASGQQFLCKAIASKVLIGYLSGDARPVDQNVSPPITVREREVLTSIALGNSNKLIARELGVSPKTVEKHRSNLMRKLRLHNAVAITMYAMRNGLMNNSAQINAGTQRTYRDAGAGRVSLPA